MAKNRIGTSAGSMGQPRRRDGSICFGLAFCLMALVTCAKSILALPITFVTALPVAQDELVVRPQAVPGYGSGFTGDLTKVTFPTLFVYGLTPRITLFTTINQSLAYFEQYSASGTETRSSSGFDDSLFFIRYTLLASQAADSLFRITPFAGAYLPSGSYNKQDEYGRSPSFLQTGSGAVDPYLGWAGLVLTKQSGFQWDTTYRYNTPASPGFTLATRFKRTATTAIGCIRSSCPTEPQIGYGRSWRQIYFGMSQAVCRE